MLWPYIIAIDNATNITSLIDTILWSEQLTVIKTDRIKLKYDYKKNCFGSKRYPEYIIPFTTINKMIKTWMLCMYRNNIYVPDIVIIIYWYYICMYFDDIR